MSTERERLREAVLARQNGAHGRSGAVALADRSERAGEGSDEITGWCPTCEERAVPMRDGTCGFCDTPLVEDDAIQDLVPGPQDLADHEADLPPVEWPHTEGTVRRQEVHDEPEVHGRVKRAHEGMPARGPILAPRPEPEAPTPEEVDMAERMESPASRSPILDWLRSRGAGTGPQIAEAIDRKPGNVSTRLRQMEKAGFVRRTGRSLPGGRGGPQIEWELVNVDDPAKPETDLDTPMTTPLSTVDFRSRYFGALLVKVESDTCPDHVYDRIERLCGIDQS